MNAASPTPSPLVPQGSIPPKNTSYSGRVPLIAATVVVFHVAVLGVVLMQGCQKDANLANAGADTNTLSLPPIESPTNSMYAMAAPTNAAPPPTNIVAYQPPVSAPPTNYMEPPVATPTVETPAVTTIDYKIMPRDTLGKIALKHKISLSALTEANPGVDPTRLQVGKTLKIPASASVAAPSPSVANPAEDGAVAPAATAGVYKVKAGDNLTKIARNHGVTVGQLRAANNLKTSQLRAGQTLKIPARTAAAAPTNTTQH